MDDQYLAMYLRLAPEFGGTRFGPFEEVETRLGSAEDNAIRLPETLGVAQYHVKVLQQSGMGLIVAPIERTAAVFVWPAGARKPKQISTPMAIRPGDGFSLVDPAGPRFIVEIDQLPPQLIEERMKLQGRWNQKLTKGAMKTEAKRQAWIAVLMTGPGQVAARSWQFIRTGTFLQPRYIFLALTIGVGYAATAFMWWRAGGLEDSLAEVQKKAQNLEKQAQFNAGEGGSILDYDFESLAREVTTVGPIGPALNDDTDLLTEVKAQAKTLSASSSYNWLIKPKMSDRQVRNFIMMREQLESFAPPEVGRFLLYAAVAPDLSADGWSVVEDSAGDEVCGRGPLGLTYRQAQNLGLDPYLDSLISGDPADYGDEGSKEKRAEKLKATDDKAIKSAATDQLEAFESTLDPLGGRNYCLSVDGSDKRTNAISVAGALSRNMGETAMMLPDFSTDSAVGLTARIAKLYIADFDNVDFSQTRNLDINLSNAPVGVVLKERGSRGKWALDKTANVIAKSIVLPCRALLESDAQGREALKDVFGDSLPDPLSCLILNYKLTND